MPRRFVVLIVAALLSACGTANDRSAGVNGSSAGPSPVVLKDTSAGQLSVNVAINLGGYETSNRDRALMFVTFQHGGHPVKFVAGEHVACGGVALKQFTSSFEASVPSAPISGRPMTCVYTSGQDSASFSFRVPKALVILSPHEHEQIPRGPHTIVTYSGEPDSTIWVVALGTNAKAVAKPDTITATTATVDTSALLGGEGSFAVTEPDLPLLELQGAQFQSLGGRAWSGTMVAVVWI